jgi:phthiocerol/phenolphthiocerol synthesis type-I polyketide synthase E
VTSDATSGVNGDGVEPIAVIGLSVRVPGARDTSAFWRNLVDGRESIRVLTREEQLANGATQTDLDDPGWVSAAPVIDELEGFDPALFGLTAREARLADPQHRLVLESAHCALEDAGYDPGRFEGAVGVYVGSGHTRYEWLNLRTNPEVWAGDAGQLSVTAVNSPDHVATQVSYRLNLHGPSMTVHTACSTSLVALHLACEALRNGECDMALAGGASVELPHGVGYRSMEGYLAPDGHCRPFDADAAGTLWGSGVGIVLVKRLADAIADGDHIRAVVRGNAVNNDGADKVGFSAPSVRGQAAVIAQALAVADVDPRTVTYVEAHGTGTALGDPIEVSALTSVYAAHSTDRQWCALGSVKSNIGHLSHAAGIVGVAKAVLALEHGLIPPTLHVRRPNPAIDFASGPFYLNTAVSKFDGVDGGPRRAAVSSFGVGGTNAHVVLEQAPPSPHVAATPPAVHLLRLSARTPTALATLAGNLADRLASDPDLRLGDVAHTLHVGRAGREHRAAVVATDNGDAIEALRDQQRWRIGRAGGSTPRVALLLSGQGSQYAGMGSRLYRTEPAFAASVDECLGHLGGDWRDRIFDGGTAHVRRTEWAQPALFVLEYALARLWEGWGVRPEAMVGHSIGEYVAATLAGVFTLPDALRLVTRRGELMQSMPPGSMLAVAMPEDRVVGLLPDGVVVAAVNSPDSTVVSGPTDTVRQFADRLEDDGVGARMLDTSHAFHSPMMDPVVARFAAEVAAVPRAVPRRPFLSNVTGAEITAVQATDPDYWARHLRQPVRFADCVASVLAQDGDWLLLECGPGRQLAGLARRQVASGGHPPVASLPSDSAGDEVAAVHEAAGALWTTGVPVTSAGTVGARRVPLPTYPFERERHWSDPGTINGRPAGTSGGGDASHGSGPLAPPDRYAVPVWRQLPPGLRVESLAECAVLVAGDRGRRLAARLREHGVRVTEVMPGQEEVAAAAPRIVHAAALDLAPAGTDPEAAWQAQEPGFLSAWALVAALATREGPARLDLLSAEAEDPVPGGLRRPEQATLIGLARVAPLEVSGLTVRRVDVGSDTSDEEIVAELLRPAGIDGDVTGGDLAEVALRAGRRWGRDYQQVSLPEADPPLRAGGRYLITGGLGGIGLTLAEDLAVRTVGELMLVTRSGLPPRQEWDALVAAEPDGRQARAVAAIRRMERAGATVHLVAADVSDAEAMRRLRTDGPMGQPHGIVHAAGVAGGGMVTVRRRADVEQVLAPKLRGTLALRAAFGDVPLDFVVLCSSTIAVAGGLGQADYCAANAFLDAHARSSHGWDARVVSVNWGGWSEVGMAAEITAPAALRTDDGLATGSTAISPDEGARALRDVLTHHLGPQVLVSPLPVPALRARARRVTVDSLAAGAGSRAAGAVGSGSPAQPGTAVAEAAADGAPRDDLEALLVGVWQQVLDVERVGIHDDFFTLGGNSLVAVQLIAQVRGAVRVKLPMRTLFEEPTVAGMAGQVAALQAERDNGDRAIPKLRRAGNRGPGGGAGGGADRGTSRVTDREPGRDPERGEA